MLSKNFIKEMTLNLIKERQELNSKIQHKLDIDSDGDETDEVQGNVLLELNHQFTARDNNKLIQIEEALNKISESTYGICEDCEESIPEKRLVINPHFPTCVRCAEKREAEMKQRRNY